MAHEIAKTADGRDAIAYVGETPWHGLGTVLQPGASLDVWAQAAGLEWTALKTPSLYHFGTEPDGSPTVVASADDFHILRSDTGESLGVMTGRYQPVQPRECLEFFKHFVEADERFSIETAGVLKAGKMIWALAKFSEGVTAGGDAHVAYVLLTTSYDGSLATTGQATMIRVVCNNTLTASLYDRRAVVRIPHCKLWTPNVVTDAHERLAKIAAEFDDFKALADAMAGARIAQHQTDELFKRLTLKGKDKAEASGKARVQYESLFRAWAETAQEGTDMHTAWGVLNAVTRYIDHDRPTRVTHSAISKGQARMASSFYGQGACMKADAIKVLAEMCNVGMPSGKAGMGEHEGLEDYMEDRNGSLLVAA
jgi:phage/plasmid-like protein (TIGR03299 family)